MPKRSSKRTRQAQDGSNTAKTVVDLAVGNPSPEKNPAAVALGRLGGLKGGKARAQKLSKRRRHEIAKMAASVRWSSPR